MAHATVVVLSRVPVSRYQERQPSHIWSHIYVYGNYWLEYEIAYQSHISLLKRCRKLNREFGPIKLVTYMPIGEFVHVFSESTGITVAKLPTKLGDVQYRLHPASSLV